MDSQEDIVGAHELRTDFERSNPAAIYAKICYAQCKNTSDPGCGRRCIAQLDQINAIIAACLDKIVVPEPSESS